MPRQNCAVCAWRENCNKRFCVSDGGARCPDFSRDITIKDIPDNEECRGTDEKESSRK